MRYTAGSFRLIYEAGFMRRISYGDTEILRNIYFALRDQNWGTFPLRIESEMREIGEDAFKIRYQAFNHRDGLDVFRWEAEMIGDAQGRLTFDLKGEALTDIWKNRAGFCILHPIRNMGGVEVEIGHTTGNMSTSQFPTYISVDNPFKDIQSLRWKINGIWYRLDVEGDIFETEDQRNWSDASFKTFCTPLSLPFPALIKQGQTIHQKVSFSPESLLPRVADSNEVITINLGEQLLSLPEIGLAMSTETDTLNEEDLILFRNLRPAHYRVEIHVDEPGWTERLSLAHTQAQEMRCSLELALHLGDRILDDLRSIMHVYKQGQATCSRVLLFSKQGMTTSQSLIDAIPILKTALGQVKIGVGTNYNFTELNRYRFDKGAADFICFSMQPQEHAFDDTTVVENLEAQEDTVLSATHIYGTETPISISPITFKKRFNPYATEVSDFYISEENKACPRQETQLGACWTLGSIKHLTDAGAASATYFQTKGKQGVLAHAGTVYPVYFALKKILDAAGTQVRSSHSSHPLLVDALVFTNGKTLIWNYTGEKQKVAFRDMYWELSPYEIKEVETL